MVGGWITAFFHQNLLRSLYNLKLIYVIIWVKVTVGFIKSNYICLVDSNIVIYYLQLSTLEIGWWIFEWRSYSFRGSTPPNRIRLWPKLCNLWSWSRKKDTSWCIPKKQHLFTVYFKPTQGELFPPMVVLQHKIKISPAAPGDFLREMRGVLLLGCNPWFTGWDVGLLWR